MASEDRKTSRITLSVHTRFFFVASSNDQGVHSGRSLIFQRSFGSRQIEIMRKRKGQKQSRKHTPNAEDNYFSTKATELEAEGRGDHVFEGKTDSVFEGKTDSVPASHMSHLKIFEQGAQRIASELSNFGEFSFRQVKTANPTRGACYDPAAKWPVMPITAERKFTLSGSSKKARDERGEPIL
jgi:hypothetical protein